MHLPFVCGGGGWEWGGSGIPTQTLLLYIVRVLLCFFFALGEAVWVPTQINIVTIHCEVLHVENIYTYVDSVVKC